jgi:hypothetical protein
MQAVGLNPQEYEVGQGMSINPITGQAEFGFLKKLAKSVKKVVKKVAPIAAVIPGPWQPFAAVYQKGNAALKLAKGEGGLGDIMTIMAGGNQSVFGKDGALKSITSGDFKNIGGGFMDSLGKIGQVAKRDAAGNIMKDAAGKTITEFAPIAYGSNVLKGMASDQKQGYGGIFGGGTGQFDVTTGELNSFGYVDAFGNEISASDFASLDPATQKAFSPVTQGINLTGGQSITDIMGGKNPIEYASSKLLPQSVEDALNTGPGGDGIFSGGGGGGSGINPQMAALALLYGKAVKDAAEKTEGGLTDIRQSVRPDLNPAPVFAGFDLGVRKAAAFGGPIGYGRQQFNKGGLAAIGELDMRDGGESVGPGTGTSDDIPAMLSDGEFVMTAAANNGAGGFQFNKTKKGIELIASSKPDREKGVDVMNKLMDTFEKYNASGSMA